MKIIRKYRLKLLKRCHLPSQIHSEESLYLLCSISRAYAEKSTPVETFEILQEDCHAHMRLFFFFFFFFGIYIAIPY
jgi:hypothetical protein